MVGVLNLKKVIRGRTKVATVVRRVNCSYPLVGSHKVTSFELPHCTAREFVRTIDHKM